MSLRLRFFVVLFGMGITSFLCNIYGQSWFVGKWVNSKGETITIHHDLSLADSTVPESDLVISEPEPGQFSSVHDREDEEYIIYEIEFDEEGKTLTVSDGHGHIIGIYRKQLADSVQGQSNNAEESLVPELILVLECKNDEKKEEYNELISTFEEIAQMPASQIEDTFGGILQKVKIEKLNSEQCVLRFLYARAPQDISDSIIPENGFITEMVIPHTVTNIEEKAFRGWTSLKKVIIHGLISSIGDMAFNGCSNLTSVEILNPFVLTQIGEEAFSECTSLSSFIIPEGVKSIEYGTFSGCKSLTKIIIPNHVLRIEDWAFSECTSLSTVFISNSVTNIERGAFQGCSSLTSIVIPKSVIEIDENAFPKQTNIIRQ